MASNAASLQLFERTAQNDNWVFLVREKLAKGVCVILCVRESVVSTQALSLSLSSFMWM